MDPIWLDILWRAVAAVAVTVVVVSIAGYSVLAERKVSSWIQGRVGPNRTALPLVSSVPVIGKILVGIGLWQPLADGLKFLFKEDPVPGHVNKPFYYLAPILALVPAVVLIAVIPFGLWWDDSGTAHPLVLANLDIGILFIFAVSSLGVYGIVLAGWSANSKYPYHGGIRASAQMISYELAMGLSILPVFIWVNAPGQEGTLSLFAVVESQQSLWLFMWQPLSALIFLTALFAEANRAPFDMAESETDLVGGFHTEYGSFKFGLFFVAEYTHMVIGSAVFTLLFFGGWHFLPTFGFLPEAVVNPWPEGILGSILSTLWFLAKTLFLVFFFIWVRWTLPRFRYDQVMKLGWNILLPVALANLVFYIFAIALYDLL